MDSTFVDPVNMTHGIMARTTTNLTATHDDNASAMSIFDPEDSAAYVFIKRLQTVLIPIICVLGIAGNVMAAWTFLSPSLNKTSCCFHLACKSLNDIGFLLSLFVVWLYRLRVPLFATPGVCQVTVFLTYVCGCLSVWLVVAITLENFIRFTRPHLVPQYCRVVVAKWLVAVSAAVSALCYSCSLWTTGVRTGLDGQRHCTSLTQFASVVMVTTVIDTGLTLLVPSVLMSFLISAIVFTSMESYERKRRLRTAASVRGRQKKRLTPEGKMTTFLFALSVIFLFLNLPTHAIRLKMLIQVYLHQQDQSHTDFILQRVFEILLYFNFSTNCLIYLLFGERFRAAFKAIYLRRWCWPAQDMVKQAPSVTGQSQGSPILLQNVALAEAEDSVCLTCLQETNEGSCV